MAKSKLISIRMDETALAYVDSYASKHGYLTRSKVINNFVNACLFCCAGDGTEIIANCFDPYDEKLVLNVSKKSL